jgi:hypothetical protein
MTWKTPGWQRFGFSLCYNSPLYPYRTQAVSRPTRSTQTKGDLIDLSRLFSALLIVLGLFLLISSSTNSAATAAQQQSTPASRTASPTPSPTPPKSPPAQKGTVTAEQVVESVIFFYGTRPGLEQIRRNGVERGKVTRFPAQGNPEESNYERRFIRGESLEKDKIRLDQRMPTMEYSLIYREGRIWGVINGTPFTPREDAATNFISQHHHSLDSLLRYKENGSTINLVGKEQQKGLDLYVVDLEDKEKRKTRFYVSARSLRVLWLEYQAAPTTGATPVKYMKKFLDYRIVQQTLVPYRIVLFEDGRQSQETRLLTITYGAKVDDSFFKNPEA